MNVREIIDHSLHMAGQTVMWRGRCQISMGPSAYRRLIDEMRGASWTKIFDAQANTYHGHRIVIREHQDFHVEVLID